MSNKTQTAKVETTNVGETKELFKGAITMTPEQRLEFLLKDHKSISGVMRYLIGTGMKTGEVAKFIGKRYQHVNNVLKTPLKKVEAPATVTE
jgi:hypothetical protein